MTPMLHQRLSAIVAIVSLVFPSSGSGAVL